MCAALGMFLGLNLLAAKWAQAQVSHLVEARGLELGRQLYEASSLMNALEGTAGPRSAGGAHQMLLNGAEVALHSGSVRLSEGTTLRSLVDRVRHNCGAAAGALSSGEAVVRAPLIEWVGESEAFVYCLKTDRSLSLDAISEMFDEFAKTGDLSKWGVFQGAYFRADDESVSILTAEITRGLSPARMFPAGRDAPGQNMAALPVPVGRRLLAVAHNGRPALSMHEASGTATAVLDEYHERLIDAGLSVERAPLPTAESDSKRSLALVARSRTEAFVITVREVEASSHLVIARLPD